MFFVQILCAFIKVACGVLHVTYGIYGMAGEFAPILFHKIHLLNAID